MKAETTNLKLSDKVYIEGGTGFLFHLFLDLKNPKVCATAQYKKIPTWELLMQDMIEFCIGMNIPLSYVAAQGSIQQGDARLKLPACAVERIAEYLLTSK